MNDTALWKLQRGAPTGYSRLLLLRYDAFLTLNIPHTALACCSHTLQLTALHLHHSIACRCSELCGGAVSCVVVQGPMFTIPRELEPSFHLSSDGQYNPPHAVIDATGRVAATAAVGDAIGVPMMMLV